MSRWVRYRLRVILTSAHRNDWDQGIMSIFDKMMRPTLTYFESRGSKFAPLLIGHYSITLKRLKISLSYFLALNIIYFYTISDNFKLNGQGLGIKIFNLLKGLNEIKFLTKNVIYFFNIKCQIDEILVIFSVKAEQGRWDCPPYPQPGKLWPH